jgi:hypothetical protein
MKTKEEILKEEIRWRDAQEEEKWIIKIAKKFGIEPEQVKDVKKLVGKSHRKICKEIRDNVC